LLIARGRHELEELAARDVLDSARRRRRKRLSANEALSVLDDEGELALIVGETSGVLRRCTLVDA
jgi:hypothetical protein